MKVVTVGRGKIINAPAFEALREMPDESVDCVVTSPPYWKKRDYSKEAVTVWGGRKDCSHSWTKFGFCSFCGAWKGQLGLEPNAELYIEHLTVIFKEIYRVLKPTGTFWLNIADTYENKSLCLIPERLVFALLKQGWKVRNVIIWHKPNAMPEAVKDRFTNDYEFIFFLTKSDNYYFKQILEPYTAPLNRWGGEKLKARGRSSWDKGTGQKTYRDRLMRPNPEGRNRRTVWSIPTTPTPYPHFAVFPEKIPELCIEAGCPQNGIVLDPFLGSGTTAVVAEKTGREWIGIEINEEYCKIAVERIRNTISYLW